jgi:hypothetical protein
MVHFISKRREAKFVSHPAPEDSAIPLVVGVFAGVWALAAVYLALTPLVLVGRA